jgi:hypothetical protein
MNETMQDNLPKDPFADHAWEEMRKLLDREMPEQKRRVPLFWWWILLPLAGLGYWAWTELNTPETKPQVLKRPDVPVAVQETPQQAPSAVAAQPAVVPSEGSTDIPASAKNGTTTQAKTQRLIQTNTSQVNITEVNKPVLGQKSEAKNPLQSTEVAQLAQNTPPVTAPNVEEETAMPSNPEHVKQPNESTTNVNASSEKIKETISGIANVASRQADFEHQMLLPALNLPLQEVAPNEVKPDKTKNLGLWADAGLGTVANVGDLTYHLGGSVLLQKGRFGLRSGLAYERNQGELVSSQTNQSGKLSDPTFSNRENNNTQTGSPSTVNSSGFQPVNLPLPEMGFSSFSMPLVLQWRPFKKLGIESGVSMQYLRGLRLNEDFLQSSTGTVYVSNSADLISTVQLSGSKGQTIDVTVQNQFAWGVQGALLYDIEKRWQLSLGYRRNLSSFLNTPTFTLQPQWMEVGLRFKVK